VTSVIPMRLATCPGPFDSPDWIFELKYDGFRALATVRDGECSLVSRNQHEYRAFQPLQSEIARLVKRDCILDGEIVCFDAPGRPRFYDLLRRRGTPCFLAFDILELDGRDLKQLPLLQRKAILERVVRDGGRLLRAKYVEARGCDLFRLICAEDHEGIVAKWKHGRYFTGDQQPEDRRIAVHASSPRPAERLTWLKIRNPAYSQMTGRSELFERRACRSLRVTSGNVEPADVCSVRLIHKGGMYAHTTVASSVFEAARKRVDVLGGSFLERATADPRYRPDDFNYRSRPAILRPSGWVLPKHQ
jgi:hypothetical protein